jgi:hypothetical protein
MAHLMRPLMLLGLYQHKGVFLRSLGDHIHFKIPLWRNLLWDNGCVAGTPQNCQQLMEAKEHILVFPGGGREVMKNKGEEYPTRLERAYRLCAYGDGAWLRYYSVCFCRCR